MNDTFAIQHFCMSYLSPVKVLDYSNMQILFSLPFALHGVVEELSERPV